LAEHRQPMSHIDGNGLIVAGEYPQQVPAG
jgi:hypothetical protein